MKRLIVWTLCLFSVIAAQAAPKEVWLTPEKRAAFERVRERPYIVKQERLNANTVVYHWTNNAVNVTTQKLSQVMGAKSHDARREALESLLANNAILLARYAEATNRIGAAKANLQTLKKKAPAFSTLIDNVATGLENGK